MKVELSCWYTVDRASPHFPVTGDDWVADMTPEQIVDLHNHFDVMVISRGGDKQGTRKNPLPPSPVVTIVRLDVKGGGFKQR